MKLRLLVIGPNNRTYSHIVYQPSIRVGSHPDCEMAIPTDISPIVSRFHALIDLTDDGAFITDLESTNGTYLNGKKLTERSPLSPADEVRLGQQGPVLRAFTIDDQPGVEATMRESKMPPRPPALPKPPAPPAPAIPFALSPPPPLPAAKAAVARRETLDERDDSVRQFGGSRSRPQRNQKLYAMIGGGVLLVGTLVGILIWQLGKKGSQSQQQAGEMTPEQIHKRVVQSAAYIEVAGPGFGGTGSGSLIDKDRRLVLTAFHVINGATDIKVTFAKYDADGKLLTSKNDYGLADRFEADVVAKDPAKDLAILRLRATELPNTAIVLPLAADSPTQNEEVHTVGGSPAESIGLWIPSNGRVREVQKNKFNLGKGQRVDAWVIHSSNPINRGDSGGALVNKKCELVGVVCANMGEWTDQSGQTKITADLVKAFIDVREVKSLLSTVPGSPRTEVKVEPKGEPKLVGRWAATNKSGILEFTQDGRLIFSANGKQNEARYRRDLNKITVTFNILGKEDSDDLTIKLLTETRLIFTNPAGKDEEYTRIN